MDNENALPLRPDVTAAVQERGIGATLIALAFIVNYLVLVSMVHLLQVGPNGLVESVVD